MKIKFAAYALTLFTILSCNSNAQTKKVILEPKKGQAIAVLLRVVFGVVNTYLKQ
jgi:peptide-methionine (S)-S-oxide reductase